MRRMPVTSRGVSFRHRFGSIRPSKLSSRPMTSQWKWVADLTTARMTAFSPGASPPPVRMPILLRGAPFAVDDIAPSIAAPQEPAQAGRGPFSVMGVPCDHFE